jgi:histidine triad (HIT) family protein
MNGTCIFCRIVAGEIPAVKLYEDDLLLAFLDIAPVNKGHALLIPKRHYFSVTEIPAATSGHLLETAGRLGAALLRAVDADGFNLLLSNGTVAGQVVPHAHLHVIPRFPEDGLVLPSRHVPYADAAEKEAVAAEVRKRLAPAIN